MARTDTGLIFDAEAHAMRKRDRELIPTRLVVAMFSLAVLVTILVAIAVLTDRPLEGTPPAAAVVKTHELTLTGNGNAMHVVDGEGAVIFDGHNGGFISVVNDGLEYARHKARIETNPPVIITEYADGRIELFDPASGWKSQLSSFGAGNLNVWRALLAQSQ
ncbi:MAG: photosynthetic complex assembly protein PuhC [Paracoccaceae bacterium]|nr:photosynthetic complex assembly protein PuhC [Paracoccaceae bacterium]